MAGSTNQEYKKAERKVDEGLVRFNRHGKQPHQRMKPYLVYDYLLRKTDEEHLCAAYDISTINSSQFFAIKNFSLAFKYL